MFRSHESTGANKSLDRARVRSFLNVIVDRELDIIAAPGHPSVDAFLTRGPKLTILSFTFCQYLS